MSADERRALIALAHAVEPGDRSIGRRVHDTSAGQVLAEVEAGIGTRHAEGLRARLRSSDWGSAEARAARLGVRIVTRVDAEWPTQLDDLGTTRPLALWVLGAASLRLACLRSVAMVGARACSPYGEDVARCWAAELAGESWSVVSGGAYGIDAAAHRGALAADGITICVQAGGVDRPYPRAHEQLVARIADSGLVLSESPLGESVRRQRFLSRNRVIAALTRATVVVEAAERSGTLATARAASVMRRPVLAVPGPVTSPASRGCHRMIRDTEALLVADVSDVLDLLDLERIGRHHAPPARSRVDSVQARVLDALPAHGSRELAELETATALNARAVLSALDALAAQGRVSLDAGGWRLA